MRPKERAGLDIAVNGVAPGVDLGVSVDATSSITSARCLAVLFHPRQPWFLAYSTPAFNATQMHHLTFYLGHSVEHQKISTVASITIVLRPEFV